MKTMWWKILSILILLYVIIIGLTGDVPDLENLHQTIRNLYFHVCMWFVMITLLSVSFVNSLLYLSGNKSINDIRATEGVNVGLLFGVLGIITGMIWAKYSWTHWWMNDPKLNGAAVGILIYLAYTILRNSIEDTDKKARISAVYNVFGYIMFVLFILILPKISNGSVHPGDNPGDVTPVFNIDNSMRLVFYPAIVGWILLGFWIFSLKVRIKKYLIFKA
jgi:heme exporter protein C